MFELPLSYQVNTNFWQDPNKYQPAFQSAQQSLQSNINAEQMRSRTNFSNQAISGGLGAIQAGANIYAQGQEGINQARSLNTEAPTQQTDIYGRPIYNLNQFTTDVNAMQPKGSSFGQVASAGLQGASAGAAFGPWGAAIGGAVGVGTSLIQGGIKKKIESKQRRIARMNLMSAQQAFNSSLGAFNQTQAARGLYEQLSDDSTRFQNFYRY